jgi:uncharacterized membrane protein YfcA
MRIGLELMQASVLIPAALVILATHSIGAITGYGSSLLALPLLAWVVGDLKTAVIVLLLVGSLQSYQLAFYTFRHVDWRELRRIIIWAGIGLPIGFACMHRLPEKPLLLTLGVVVILSGASRLMASHQTNEQTPPRIACNLLLFSGGIIHGAFACGGATLAIHAQYALIRKETIRGTLSMVWVILNTVMLLNAGAQGMLTTPAVRLALIGIPLVLLGSWFGELVARKIKQQHFVRLMAALLVIAGISTICRGMR